MTWRVAKWGIEEGTGDAHLWWLYAFDVSFAWSVVGLAHLNILIFLVGRFIGTFSFYLYPSRQRRGG